MDSITEFSKISEFLKHPLVFMGFVLMLVFSIHKLILKASILEKLTSKDSGVVVRLLLRYGFLLGVLIVFLGFCLQFYQAYASDKSTVTTSEPSRTNKTSKDIELKPPPSINYKGNQGVVGNSVSGNLIINNENTRHLEPGILSVSDIIVDDYREDFTAVVDFRLLNRGDKSLTISRVKFDVIKTDKVPTAGFLDFSAKYDLDISNLEKIGDHAEVMISQVLQPGEADRIAIILTANKLGIGIFQLWKLQPTFVTSEGEVQAKIINVGLPWNIAISRTLPGAILPRGDIYFSCEPVGRLKIANDGEIHFFSHVRENMQEAHARFTVAKDQTMQVNFLPSGSDYLMALLSIEDNKRLLDIRSIKITFQNETADCKATQKKDEGYFY